MGLHRCEAADNVSELCFLEISISDLHQRTVITRERNTIAYADGAELLPAGRAEMTLCLAAKLFTDLVLADYSDVLPSLDERLGDGHQERIFHDEQDEQADEEPCGDIHEINCLRTLHISCPDWRVLILTRSTEEVEGF